MENAPTSGARTTSARTPQRRAFISPALSHTRISFIVGPLKGVRWSFVALLSTSPLPSSVRSLSVAQNDGELARCRPLGARDRQEQRPLEHERRLGAHVQHVHERDCGGQHEQAALLLALQLDVQSSCASMESSRHLGRLRHDRNLRRGTPPSID